MSNKINFVNPEHITTEEIQQIFKENPVDFIRVMNFLNKEPGIKEAFAHYSKQYITDFMDSLGVTLRPSIIQKLRDTLISCLTIGYLTRENLFQSSLKKMLGDGKDGSAKSTD